MAENLKNNEMQETEDEILEMHDDQNEISHISHPKSPERGIYNYPDSQTCINSFRTEPATNF